MKKYRTGSVRWRVHPEIEEVEVKRESVSCVWLLDGTRSLKETDFHQYHDTWEAAYQFLIMSADNKVRGAKRALKDAEEAYDSIFAMRKPGEIE